MDENKDSMKEIQKKLETEDLQKKVQRKTKMDELENEGPVITEVHHDDNR